MPALEPCRKQLAFNRERYHDRSLVAGAKGGTEGDAKLSPVKDGKTLPAKDSPVAAPGSAKPRKDSAR